MTKKLVFELPELDVRLYQHGGSKKLFTLTYGKQVQTGLTYRAAAAEFGACAFHALACLGKLDNNGV